jgi:hypothetical protein
MGLNNEVERQGDDIDWEDEEEHMWGDATENVLDQCSSQTRSGESPHSRELTVKDPSIQPGVVKRIHFTNDTDKVKSVVNERVLCVTVANERGAEFGVVVGPLPTLGVL